jgi:hypothetical protein
MHTKIIAHHDCKSSATTQADFSTLLSYFDAVIC